MKYVSHILVEYRRDTKNFTRQIKKSQVQNPAFEATRPEIHTQHPGYITITV